MKYYSEDDVMDLIREAEDCERAYECGEGHRRIHFEDYHPIEIPDEHGRIVDISRVEDFLTKWENGELDYEPYLDEVLSMIRYSIKTILEASNVAGS